MAAVDDWKEEYKELSEDYRFFVQIGWQSTLAIFGVDGILIGAVIQAHFQSPTLGLLPLFGAALTFIMASQQYDWNKRWIERINLLYQHDWRHGLNRFRFPRPPAQYPRRGVAWLVLQIIVGVALVIYALVLFIPPLQSLI
jgi:hypothetical protein